MASPTRSGARSGRPPAFITHDPAPKSAARTTSAAEVAPGAGGPASPESRKSHSTATTAAAIAATRGDVMRASEEKVRRDHDADRDAEGEEPHHCTGDLLTRRALVVLFL